MRIWIALPVLALCLFGVAFGAKLVTNIGMNNPPPAGAILDLAGTPIPGGGSGTVFQAYSVNFVETLSNTQITFAFREDPAFLAVENFSVVDVTASSGNLLVDGDMSAGTAGNNTPPGWTYANVFGASASGVVQKPCSETNGPNSAVCWYDGAVGAYDAVTQVIATTVGHTYRISFSLADNSDCGGNFTQLSGGNCGGIDMTVYALAGLPGAAQTPAPPSFWLLLSALGMIGVWQLRKRLA